MLHEIFFLCTMVSEELNLDTVEGGPRYPPIWVAITYVCHRWRVVALDFRKLWSTITPDLSPKWLATFMQRSSYTPRHVDIHIGPFSENAYHPAQLPLPAIALPIEVIEEILSHVSCTEDLHLSGETADVIRVLNSLGRSTSLTSLHLDFWDEFEYSQDDDSHEQPDISLILPETLFSGCAPRLRHLYCHFGLHVTFPPWVLGNISEFTASRSFSAKRLFSALRQMPQLEVLRVSFLQDWFEPNSEGAAMPVDLKNLTLLVIEGTSLEFFTALLGCLSMPANVRNHLKFKLDESEFGADLWEKFTSLMWEKTTASPYRLHGIHFRREPRGTSVCAWASPIEPGPGLAPSPHATSDGPFRLEIRITGLGCPHNQDTHTSNTISSFHRLQRLCVSLGGPTVQELSLEYQKTLYSRSQPIPMILCRCWRSLFSCFPSLKTLRFGDGAEVLLASASYAASVYPRATADDRGFLFGSLQRVIFSKSIFSTEILWRWIHYAFTRPPEWDVSDLRKDVETLLLAACWHSEVGFVEGVTESLLLFLLYCRRLDVQVFEVSFVESSWDNPGGLPILQQLLHMLDPDWSVILEATSPTRLLMSVV